MAYLQHGLPRLQRLAQNQGEKNTTNRRYNASQIHDPNVWVDFNLHTIRQRFGTTLDNARIDAELLHSRSPVRGMNSETVLRARVDAYLSNRVTRALRVGFHFNKNTPPHRRLMLTPVLYDAGNMAHMIEQFIPDIAYYRADDTSGRATNCVPGDIKPSYKWDPGMEGNARKNTEFKQALSQVNFYANQHHTRYTFILTNLALVAIRLKDPDGNLELSKQIPWTASGTTKNPVLTVPLAMWYLGMLASNDDGPGDWQLPPSLPPPPVPGIPSRFLDPGRSGERDLRQNSGKGSGQGSGSGKGSSQGYGKGSGSGPGHGSGQR